MRRQRLALGSRLGDPKRTINPHANTSPPLKYMKYKKRHNERTRQREMCARKKKRIFFFAVSICSCFVLRAQCRKKLQRLEIYSGEFHIFSCT